MADTEIILSYPYQGDDVGTRLSVDTSTAKRLVRAGVALYATKKDAEGAGDSTEKTATARKRT
jgi:hypothetical protein